MDDMLQTTLENVVSDPLVGPLAGPLSGPNYFTFLLVAGLGLLMALVYVPLRLFLTITTRSRRLRLLQQIRRLREELGQPIET
ncbi:hypothetical protein [Cyanobium sp. Morenito 9A2]|uniref:hypothetical protein n=1 Tax=Cyanobium sp. Morenito 9A2 TaxID=2823718 RepID=UPI0020CD4008|nr:hypothetical protein [Cyanobium sp. Morenito 9A2]MCP9848284.1 hypothetical protein [Cyanobium sp. Morenito 9A2]